MVRSTKVRTNLRKGRPLTNPVMLIGHNDAETIEIASGFADRNGFRPCVELDELKFTRAYIENPPTLILYEFFTDYLDGIELVRWLIEEKNTARVVMTAASNLNVTAAAVAMAQHAGLFSLTVLPPGVSDSHLLAALETG